MKLRLSANQVVLVAAAFMTLTANFAFFHNLAGSHGPGGLLVLGVLVFIVTVLLGLLGASRWLLKPWLTVLLLLAAGSAYFMDSFNVVIDREMIQNALLTDMAETGDLTTSRMLVYVLLLGVVPVTALWGFVEVSWRSLGAESWARAKLLGACLVSLVAVALLASPMLSSFIRDEKPLRYYANPASPLYGAYRYARHRAATSPPGELEEIAEKSVSPEDDADRELIIMVVGETVRADHFSLNGYERDTNPLLSKLGVISFRDVSACGTSTAVSVPCMFSERGHDSFDSDEERSRENVLDLLGKAGVSMLWRDNNSSSKGVADRIASEDFRSPDHNRDCDVECRDAGMLEDLQSFVDDQPEGDILIVLHQMGSHGPAYFKRYPESFRRFQPTCETAQLDDCGRAEIINSYDNSIVYTDWFLANVIALLKRNDEQFETAMMYVGDHGESLGEYGLYLHGAPLWLAPQSQTRVPMVFWFGRNYHDVDVGAFRALSATPVSHDNVFHTLLGLFEIETEAYRPDLDLLQLSRDSAGIETAFAGPP